MITLIQKIYLAIGITMVLFTLTLSSPIYQQGHGQIGAPSASEITFKLFATDMSGCDKTSDCDLFVRIHCRNTDWTVCGETSKIQDDNNPVWTEVFTLKHAPGTNQRWKFELIDVDVVSDDHVATIEVDVDEYADKAGNLQQISVPGNTGTIWIHRQR